MTFNDTLFANTPSIFSTIGKSVMPSETPESFITNQEIPLPQAPALAAFNAELYADFKFKNFDAVLAYELWLLSNPGAYPLSFPAPRDFVHEAYRLLLNESIPFQFWG